MNKLADIQLTKLYYSIGEVAAIFSVNTSLIRFWEKEFDIIQPKKNKKGNRLFTVKDIEHFNKIYQLVKENGYTLDGAKKALKSPVVADNLKEATIVPSDSQRDSMIATLENVKKQLITLKRK